MKIPFFRHRVFWLMFLLLSAAVILARVFVVRSSSVVSTWAPLPSSRIAGEGTREMAQYLKDRAQTRDPWRDTFALSTARIQSLKADLARTSDPHLRVSLLGQQAEELLNAGDTEEAIRAYQEYGLLAQKHFPGYYRELQWVVTKGLAMCYLRLGEQQNCCANNNTDSCLLPIRGKGIHTLPLGSREGIRRLTRYLEHFPDDLAARWSLNIAYMTLDEYPQRVPLRWRIPPEAFRSEANVPRFPNLAPQKDLALEGLAGGCVIEDFDNDGWLDILVARCGVTDPLRFFHNTGEGTFVERTKEAGLTGEVGGINLIQADYNNDGAMDVLVLRGGGLPSSLLANHGDGTFEDTTVAAGLSLDDSSRTAVWLDYDRDGYLDLFVGGTKTRPCALYRNNANGTFTECAQAAGVALKGTFQSVVSLDYNNDGRPDLFITRLGAPNLLLRNEGTGRTLPFVRNTVKFQKVTQAAGLAAPLYALSCVAFDYDNDGWEDLFLPYPPTGDTSDVAAHYLGKATPGVSSRLYHNRHDGTFEEVGQAIGLDSVLMGQAVNCGDIDNDGYLDLYVGTGGQILNALVPNRMFRNAEGNRFQEVTTAGDFGHLQKGCSISFGDLTNNGQQDIYEVMGGVYAGDIAHNILFVNPGSSNPWVTLQLEGVHSNRCAIGARLTVTLDTPAGVRVLHRTVRSGGSWGASPLRLVIGLGKATAIRSLEIAWPSGGQTKIETGLSMNRRYKIRENVRQPMLQ